MMIRTMALNMRSDHLGSLARSLSRANAAAATLDFNSMFASRNR